MKFDEMENNISCKDGGHITLDTNGTILFAILKELKEMNETLNDWDLARRELEIWHSK